MGKIIRGRNTIFFSVLLLQFFFPDLSSPIFLPQPAFAADQKTAMIGTLSGVSGLVEVQKRGTTEWLKAVNGMRVSTGDQINTGIDGNAVLKFENSTTEVRPLTQFAVGRAMEDSKEYYTEMFLSVGKIVSVADKSSGKANRFTVTTPSAVAGIRGTQQEVSFGEGFGTQCKIEDGQGYMAPVQADKLPAAVQMVLGVAPAAAPSEGAGGAVSAAATGASREAAGATADAVTAALDKWLEASFDNQVVGEEGGAEAAPAGEEAAPEAAPTADEAPLLDESTLAVDDIMAIADGQEGAVDPSGDATDPTERILDDLTPDILPEGATPAEEEAADQSTDVSDAPPSETVSENLASDDLSNLLLTADQDGDTTPNLTDSTPDLFGDPPAHP